MAVTIMETPTKKKTAVQLHTLKKGLRRRINSCLSSKRNSTL